MRINSAKKQDENFVVLVINHKTGLVFKIVFKSEFHRSTVGYVEFVRKKYLMVMRGIKDSHLSHMAGRKWDPA